MNLLPFVFTMLLLLTLTGSFMFSSMIRTTREKEVILLEHHAYLKLLSKQNKETYVKKNPQEKLKGPPKGKKKRAEKKYVRDSREGYSTSKLNIAPLFDTKNPELKQATQKILMRLIDILYSPYDFYKNSRSKNIAKKIVQAMSAAEFDAFEEIHFKNDPELDAIYYKMLKGTNTNYPALTEYCHIGEKTEKALCFRYTTVPIMRAVLGDLLAGKLFELEKKIGENNRWKVLNKIDFEKLIRDNPSPFIFESLARQLFEYRIVRKGVPQIYQKERIRALHEADPEDL